MSIFKIDPMHSEILFGVNHLRNYEIHLMMNIQMTKQKF